MTVLVDLQHPAHLHFFRNLVSRLRHEGHRVIITGRDKDILVPLARNYNLEVDIFGVARKGIFNLGRELLYRQWQLLKRLRKHKPDVMLAIAGTYVSLLGWLKRIPTFVFYDTEHATVSNLLAYPFASCVYVPRCYRKPIRWNHVRYNGYHELAYLHPRYFSPDPSVLAEVGLQPGDRFTLLRFVNWGAGHDIGLSGLTLENKIRVVKQLETFGPVFISSEGELPQQLEPYRLQLDVSRVHHLMAYAALLFGESATMASECAVLGVPSVYIDPVGRGYTDQQQTDYGIVFNFTHQQQEQAMAEAQKILTGYDEKKWRDIGQRIISEKIDVTQMLYNIAVNPVSPPKET